MLLAFFSLLLSAVSEAFRRQSWKFLFLFAVLVASRCFRQPSWMLQFAVLAVLSSVVFLLL